MTSTIKSAVPYAVSQQIIEQFLARQSKINFVRSLSDNREAVAFQPNSSLRLWYNNNMLVYPPHWHNACEMIAPVEGSYLVTVSGQTFELAPGDIFLIPSGEPTPSRPRARAEDSSSCLNSTRFFPSRVPLIWPPACPSPC